MGMVYMEQPYFGDLATKYLNRFIPELKGREDYEAERIETQCIECGGKDFGWKYRIHGENEWKEWGHGQICSNCEAEKEFLELQKAEKKRAAEMLMSRYWYIPKDLEIAGFKTYERTNNVTKNAANTCVDYVKRFMKDKPENRHNLLFMGNPGTGKSHLSASIARTLKEAGYLVGFITTGKLLALIKNTYHPESEWTENDILEDIKKFDLLVLDDLGAEQGSKDEFSWAKAKLFEIINSRLGKPTIYTTNFDDDSIVKAVGDRIASRLYVKTQFIDLFTDDYRKRLMIKRG